MSDTIIHAQDLQKRFGNHSVLNGLNLDVQAGHVVGLLGTNGSGKTTLIKCLLGLLKVDEGACSLLGDNSWDLSAVSKSKLGYVSQEFVLLPWMTVQSMVDYTAAFYEKWDYAYGVRLLKEWDLDTKQRVGALSVGQRQKLAVILALGHHPELLMLDEPVASLDPVARRHFLQSLIDFTEDEQNTILFSTHITTDLERVASHVAFLQSGKVGFYGELDELKHQVKRLRISSEQSLPQSFRLPGILRSEVNGNHALLAVRDFEQQALDTLEQELNASVKVEDLSLEEIFLELSGIATQKEAEVSR